MPTWSNTRRGYRCGHARQWINANEGRDADDRRSAVSSVGSWAWAEETNGRLRRRDRAELLREGMLARLTLLPGPWRRAALGDHPPAAIPDPPDSALAIEAEEKVRALSSAPLYAHCLRTWAFAALFAARGGVKHDRELLYLACVLHDLGLTEAHTCQDKTAQCFAVEGARAARDFLRTNGDTTTARAGSPRPSRFISTSRFPLLRPGGRIAEQGCDARRGRAPCQPAAAADHRQGRPGMAAGRLRRGTAGRHPPPS